MSKEATGRFEDLTYDDFRKLANDPSLSRYERIGFPDSYRKGKEERIFREILAKLPHLLSLRRVVLDIGPGCSDLPRMMTSFCQTQGHTLLLADSEEMLGQLPNLPCIRKFPCFYPDCPPLFQQYQGKVDVILTYSVLHYIFAEANLFAFFDRTLQLLAHGGSWLIGDIPNVSKRKRFFAAPAGVAYHREFTGTSETPSVAFNQLDEGKIDDGVILGLLLRARSAGFDAYLLPQDDGLPMSNRREDLLVRKP